MNDLKLRFALTTNPRHKRNPCPLRQQLLPIFHRLDDSTPMPQANLTPTHAPL